MTETKQIDNHFHIRRLFWKLYINETCQGLQSFDPYDQTLKNIRPDFFWPFGDIMSPNPGEIIFWDFDVFFDYDFQSETAYPLFSVIGNGFSLSVDKDDSAYFETPGKYDVLDQHIVNIDQDGILQYRDDLSFKSIRSTSIDCENRFCLYTDEGFKRVETDGQISNIAENIDPYRVNGLREFSVGPNGLWYIVTTDGDTIQASRFDENGNFETLPIFFDRQFFNGAEIWDASIDVGCDGSLAIIVTALVSRTHGPFLQRVYRADEDGNNLRLVANFDSNRVGGMVDVALGSNNEIYALTSQGSTGDPDIIYRIDQNNNIIQFVVVQAGNDPKSIDTGPNGSLWFTTTQGIFRVYPK